MVISGVFGRYLYALIPKTLQGTFLSFEAVESKRAEALSLVQDENIFDGSVLAELTQQIRPGEPRSLPHALFLGLQWDFTRRRREKKIRSLLEAVGGHSPLRRELERLAINEGCHVVEQPGGPTASIRYVPISVTDCKSCQGGGG